MMELAKSLMIQKSYREFSPCSRCLCLTVQKFFPSCCFSVSKMHKDTILHSVGGIFVSLAISSIPSMCAMEFKCWSQAFLNTIFHMQIHHYPLKHTHLIQLSCEITLSLRILRVIRSETEWCLLVLIQACLAQESQLFLLVSDWHITQNKSLQQGLSCSFTSLFSPFCSLCMTFLGGRFLFPKRTKKGLPSDILQKCPTRLTRQVPNWPWHLNSQMLFLFYNFHFCQRHET